MTAIIELTETPSPINEEAMNPELVKAIRRAKQSGPLMIPNEFKASLGQDTWSHPGPRGLAVGIRVLAEQMVADRREA